MLLTPHSLVVIYLGWKILKRTKFIKPEEMDLRTGLEEVEKHEASLVVRQPLTRYDR